MVVGPSASKLVYMLLITLSSLTVLGRSNYTLSNCKLANPRKNSTSSTHPIFEQQAGRVKFFPYLKVKVVSSF